MPGEMQGEVGDCTPMVGTEACLRRRETTLR